MFTFLRKTLLTALVALSASQANAMWIQPDWLDPTQPGVGTNRYAYSFNDPINNFDTNGNYCIPCGVPIFEALKWAGVAVLAGLGVGATVDAMSDDGIPASDRIVTGQDNGGPPLDPTPPENDPVGKTLAALAAAGVYASRDDIANLGSDPIKGFDSMEAAHGARYQETFGVTLERSTHVGADFVISGTGQTVDAMGPFPSDHFSIGSVSRSLDKHLRKSVDRVSIDATGLSKTQRDALRDNLNGRPKSERDKIDVIGLD